MKFYETKLIVKPKVLDIKNCIKGEIIKNKDGTIDIKGKVDISGMNLKTIPWNIKNVTDNFFCDNNGELESLGNLESVGGSLICFNNKLQSLGNLKYVGGNLFCQHNELESLGNLKYVGDNLWCDNNTKKFSEKEIRKTIKVKGGIRV